LYLSTFCLFYSHRHHPHLHSFPTRRSSDLHQVMVEKADSAVNIEIKPSNNDSEILLYIKFGEKPLFDHWDIFIPLRAVKSFNGRSEEHTSELQSRFDLVCRLLLEKKKINQ